MRQIFPVCTQYIQYFSNVISKEAHNFASNSLEQAVIVDKTMYISGQIGMNPKTTELVSGGVKIEAAQALNNMGEILK